MQAFLNYLKSAVTPGEYHDAGASALWATVYILIIFTGISIAVIAMNWLERKILAHMQGRLGPMRVGPHGLLQAISHALKVLLKEDRMPSEAGRAGFVLGAVPDGVTRFR